MAVILIKAGKQAGYAVRSCHREKQENYAQFKNQADRICAAVLKENSVGAIIFLFV